MNKPYYRSHASCCAVKANYNSSCEQTSADVAKTAMCGLVPSFAVGQWARSDYGMLHYFNLISPEHFTRIS